MVVVGAYLISFTISFEISWCLRRLSGRERAYAIGA